MVCLSLEHKKYGNVGIEYLTKLLKLSEWSVGARKPLQELLRTWVPPAKSNIHCGCLQVATSDSLTVNSATEILLAYVVTRFWNIQLCLICWAVVLWIFVDSLFCLSPYRLTLGLPPLMKKRKSFGCDLRKLTSMVSLNSQTTLLCLTIEKEGILTTLGSLVKKNAWSLCKTVCRVTGGLKLKEERGVVCSIPGLAR